MLKPVKIKETHMRFDINNINIKSGSPYSKIVDLLNKGNRFVVVFSQPLSVDDERHQTRVFIDDLFTARADLGSENSLPLLSLMDLSGMDLAITGNGVDLVDFASWMAAVYGRQFSGVVESVFGGEVVEVGIGRLLESKDSPDLWLMGYGDLYVSLLVFDFVDLAYRVVNTWVSGFDKEIPDDIDDAVGLLRDSRLRKMIDEYRIANNDQRVRLGMRMFSYLRQ